MMRFNIGDFVFKNPITWKPNDFDSWGRGIGIGQIVEPPYEVNESEVDVRWPSGRCFENVNGLLPAKGSDNDKENNDFA